MGGVYVYKYIYVLDVHIIYSYVYCIPPMYKYMHIYCIYVHGLLIYVYMIFSSDHTTSYDNSYVEKADALVFRKKFNVETHVQCIFLSI